MEAENHIYRQLNFQTHVCINNPHWQSRWIIKCICKYYIVTLHILVGSFLEVLFLLLILISSELHEKPIRNKDWATEKSTSKNLWEEHHFFDFALLFVAFFVYSLSPPKWRTCWMASIKIHKISEWTVKNMKIYCNLIQAGWHL